MTTGFASETRPFTIAGRRAVELTLHRFQVVVESGPDQGAHALLASSSLTIGSGEGCDLRLTDPSVSRKHLVLSPDGQGVMAQDLGSTNGTRLGAVRLQSAVVPTGTLLTLGDTTIRIKTVHDPLVVFPDERHALGGLLGTSQVMRDLFALVRQVARTDLPVLVNGETGSGKELVSRALHEASPRGAKPLLVLDCGAVLPELLPSELFGHERGAFTGADRQTRGILEEAAGGSVFLDEIGELPAAVQPMLLRALEAREVTRVGSRKATPVDFRVIAATNRDLLQASADRSFREDLYYRLACVRLWVPPLRERREDVPLLARTFIERFCTRNALAPAAPSAEALELLAAFQWPGNVRQLRNVAELLAARSAGATIDAGLVEQTLRAQSAPSGTPRTAPIAGLVEAPAQSLVDAERVAILRALQASGWDKKAAARALGISRTTLYRKMAEYGVVEPGTS